MMKEPMSERPARRARRMLAVLLLLVTLSLSLASCGYLDLSGFLSPASTTTAAPVTTARTPVASLTQQVVFDQYLTPEIPDEAGTYVYAAAVASPSVVSILVGGSGAGSGVVCHVDAELGVTYIITNHHVVEGFSSVKVYKNSSATEYPAEVVGSDWQTDIAVVRVENADFVAATFGNSSQLLVGQSVAAIGNPLGVLGGTVTPGIIGALAREIEVEGVSMTLIQHSAPVSPGNSGGGLFNLYGQLVGIVNAKSTGDGVEGLGYAIPVDLALDRAGEIISQGYVAGTPYLGITYAISSSEVVLSSYLYNDELAASNQTTLREGDILVTLDGDPIEAVADVRKVLSRLCVGDTVEAVFYRQTGFGRYQSITVTLTVHEYIPVS